MTNWWIHLLAGMGIRIVLPFKFVVIAAFCKEIYDWSLVNWNLPYDVLTTRGADSLLDIAFTLLGGYIVHLLKKVRMVWK